LLGKTDKRQEIAMTKEELIRENELLRNLLRQVQSSIVDTLEPDDDEDEDEEDTDF
jgi:hypothetical protein